MLRGSLIKPRQKAGASNPVLQIDLRQATDCDTDLVEDVGEGMNLHGRVGGLLGKRGNAVKPQLLRIKWKLLLLRRRKD